VCRAAHEKFVCEVVDELADWDHLVRILGSLLGLRRGFHM